MIKQTQTKLFNFSDVGLDFCSGSKNKFPEVFKKMLAKGFNTQTVSSVTISGSQVTLTYGVSHGYVADRVLQINASELTGEFYIDSVTAQTVTITVVNPPTSIVGGFTTYIAPLGYQLVYEVGNIHIYKFKALDESDLYLRLCFQNVAMSRNSVSPCIGKTADLASGVITDPLSLAGTRAATSPTINNNWEFTYAAGNTYDSYSYSQGLSVFGKGVVIGSKYHLNFCFSNSNSSGGGRVFGFLPTQCMNYPALNYPALLVEDSQLAPSGNGVVYGLQYLRAYIGNVKALAGQLRAATTNTSKFYTETPAYNSFTSLDGFNTTFAEPIKLYEFNTDQFLGFISGGIYICDYSATNAPPFSKDTTPNITADTDLINNVVTHPVSVASQVSNALFFALPIEEIKIGT